MEEKAGHPRGLNATPRRRYLHEMFAVFKRIIRKVPRGKVVTYGEVARAAGFPGAARQVSWALHGSSGLPWQRVVGSGGRILLRGEAGLEQRFRLQAEGVAFDGPRVRMRDHEFRFPRRKRAAKRRKRA